MIWEWIISTVPWQLWAMLGLIVAIAILYFFGNGRWIYALGVVLVGVAFALTGKSYQAGVARERARQSEADAKVRQTIDEKRADVATASPDEKDRRFKRWLGR